MDRTMPMAVRARVNIMPVSVKAQFLMTLKNTDFGDNLWWQRVKEGEGMRLYIAVTFSPFPKGGR